MVRVHTPSPKTRVAISKFTSGNGCLQVLERKLVGLEKLFQALL